VRAEDQDLPDVGGARRAGDHVDGAQYLKLPFLENRITPIHNLEKTQLRFQYLSHMDILPEYLVNIYTL
jgi:hypothetical protein